WSSRCRCSAAAAEPGPDEKAPQPRGFFVPEATDDCFASVVIGPAHDLARQWLAGRTRVALADCRELLAQVAWDSVRAA
ncbi:hypothetical protein LDZ95_12585, partial [Pseudomonas aeruginosa]|nr:hypothetical protein [Pseudomonas aeruginosa]